MLLGYDCIAYADGTVIIMSPITVLHGESKKAYISPTCDTTVQGILKYNDDIWTPIDFLNSHLILPNGDCLKCGEGAMGNEGFVSCEDASGKLKWSFFCTAFNPFKKLDLLTPDTIQLSSTNEYTMVMDINQPWKITSINNSWWK